MNSHFKDQIDKLTAIINSAVRRKKTDESQSHLFEDKPQKSSRQDLEYQRLVVMILKMQDGLLEQRHVSRLGKWVSSDEKALKCYVEFNQLSAMLRQRYGKNQNKITEELFLTRN
jgi:hypothetical protein